MSKTVYCYTQLIRGKDGVQPSMLFPQIEVMLALYRYNAMCADIDGRSTSFAGEAQAHGFPETVIESYGRPEEEWLCMVGMTMTDAGWEAVKAAVDNTNPVVWGWTPDDFVDNARTRRNQMYQNLQSWRPQVASRLDSLSDIRWLISRVSTDDVVSAAMQTWMLERIDNGISAPPLPERLLDEAGTGLDFDAAKQVWTRWRAEAEGADYRMLMRLWEFYCLNGILSQTSYGTA